jgi:2Fe-2S ferredoxin
MLGALLNNVPGIEAECGGACSCATCHVYVDERFLPKLPPMEDAENEMLTGVVAERRPNSRLSCQIPMRDELAGLRVQIPERQTM